MAKRTATNSVAAAKSANAVRAPRRASKPPQSDEGDDAARAVTTEKFERVVDNLAFDGGYD